MQDLIKRIEAADGPDRELDAEIACLIGKPLGNVCHWLHGEDISYQSTANGYYVAVIPEHDGQTRTSETFAPKEFTSSIDAAMTLVMEGWEWSLSYDGSRYVAEVWVDNSHYGREAATGDRSFASALALCAAALRARSANG